MQRLNHLAEEFVPAQSLWFGDDGAALLTGWQPQSTIGNAEMTIFTNDVPSLVITCVGGQRAIDCFVANPSAVAEGALPL